MYMDYEQQKKHKAMRAVGKVDTSAFPKEGCVVRGRSALCSVPLDVNVEGFVYKADITLGLRMLPAAEVSLIMTGETIIGPFLVWWLVGLAPGFYTWIGGGLVLLALFGNAFWRIRQQRAKQAEPASA